MATSVLDAPLPTPAAGRPARWPAAVLLLAGVSLLESVALLAAGLTCLDGLLTATPRPPGLLVAGVLGGLAAWIVLCAAGGLAAVDGSGRRLPAGVACAEVALAGALPVVATALPLPMSPPALALLVLAVPVGKLLLLSAPSAVAWAAARPPRRRTAEAAVAHPRVRLATVALIAVALTTLAVGMPTAGEEPPAGAVSGH